MIQLYLGSSFKKSSKDQANQLDFQLTITSTQVSYNSSQKAWRSRNLAGRNGESELEVAYEENWPRKELHKSYEIFPSVEKRESPKQWKTIDFRRTKNAGLHEKNSPQ